MLPRASPTPGSALAQTANSLRASFSPAVLAPLLIGGAALLATRAGWLRKLFPTEDQSLLRARRLRRAIPGNDKHAIASVLGLPQASTGAIESGAIFLANTWYYRLDERYRIAMVIEFKDDVAREVRVMHFEREEYPARKPVLSRD